MKETMINKAQIQGFGARMKHRARMVWNWTKDHAVPLAVGTAAAVGGGYLLYRRSKEGGSEDSLAPVEDRDLSWTGDLINERWDAMDQSSAESVGPSDDEPEVY